MGRLAKISKVNKQGGWNKQGDQQKHFAKILAKTPGKNFARSMLTKKT